MVVISKAEEMVLLAIWRLGDEAYGVSVRRQIRKDTRKDYTYGTLYGLLRQMGHKGYIRKIKGEPLPKKGGRSKTYFKLTPAGSGRSKTPSHSTNACGKISMNFPWTNHEV
jgi:DNA-binding PadR family transcriptional regulator